MNEEQSKSAGRYGVNAASSVMTRLLQLTVLVWVNQYLLKRIDAQEYSLFPVVMSLMIFADMFKNMFIGGIGRYIVEADSRGDDEGVTRVVSSIFPALLLLAVGFLAVGGLAIWKIDSLLELKSEYVGDARMMLGLLVVMVCVDVIAAPFSVGLYVKQMFVRISIIDLSCELVRIAVLLVLLFAVSTKVMWLVVASSTAIILNVIIRVVLTRRLMPAVRFRPALASMPVTKKLIGFGSWTSVGHITNFVSYTVPVFLLSHFGTAIDIAALHIGRLPDQNVRRIALAAMIPAQPAMTRMFAKEGKGSLTGLYYRGGRYHLWLIMAVVAPFLIFGKEIATLYAGPQYAATATVWMALFGCYPFIWASAMFYRVAHAEGKVAKYYLCEITTQVVTLAALFYAIVVRGAGAPGAGLAIGLSAITTHLLLIWPMGLKSIGGTWLRFFRETVLPGSAPMLFAVLVCWIYSLFAPLDSWASIGIGTACSLLVYGAVMLGLCLDPLDKTLLSKTLRGLRQRIHRLAPSHG
ncbi:lipopolysaccharide biosynthesis protein [Haloferula sp.]|uniref:lipopolysaccharide biosynthesis protein n=1 Tax=Haloferula sp. TaxID=2497595 RepID=UPI00329B23CD